MPLTNAVQSLIAYCQEIGRRIPVWTQGAGGNLSVKDQGVLYIKASGLRLDQVRDLSSLAELSMTQFDETFALRRKTLSEQDYGKYLEDLSLAPQKRASMESLFHLLLPGKYVCHFHSVPALLMGFRLKDPQALQEFQKQSGVSIALLSLVKPGLELGLQIAHEAPNAEIIVLENHGVVLQSSRDSFFREWVEVERLFVEQFYSQHPLAEFLGSDAGFSGDILDRLSSGPFKIYFPDMAVFADRLRVCLRARGNLFEWTAAEDSPEILSLWELWAATQLIYLLEPQFPEISDELAAEISRLPIEAFRRRVQG